MQKIQITTGFGYFIDQARHKIAKAELPPGEHPLRDGFIYIEVANKAALNAIELYVDPIEQKRRQDEALVAQKSRELVIAALIADGKLPGDYK